MPTTEKPLRLEFSVPQSGFTVNSILEWAKTIPAAVVAAALEEEQDRILVRVLGEPWAARQPQEPAPWACPKCGSRIGFSRRGTRARRIRTSTGIVVFGLRQVTCHACHSKGVNTTFSPFPDLLGLPARVRVSQELLQKGVDAATRLSYHQASEVTQIMTGQSLSPWRIHKEVQKRAQQVDFEIPTEALVLFLDSTKVKAGVKKYGVDLNLAMTISAVSQAGTRRVLEKQIIAMDVGRWASLKERLKQVKPHLILVDGDDELERLVAEVFPGVPVQRCLWHLPRSFGYNLWRGRSMKWERKNLIARLGQILHSSEPVEVAQAALQAFADTLDLPGEELARTTLCGGIATAFTHRTLTAPLPGGRQNRNAPIATGAIERQMREIDRRADNGSRWTESGVLNLLRLQVLRRLDPDEWMRLWAG